VLDASAILAAAPWTLRLRSGGGSAGDRSGERAGRTAAGSALLAERGGETSMVSARILPSWPERDDEVR
jgi:hypothetical protein